MRCLGLCGHVTTSFVTCMYTQTKGPAQITTKAGAMSVEVATDVCVRDLPTRGLRAPLLRHALVSVLHHRRPAAEDWAVGDLGPDAVLCVHGGRRGIRIRPITWTYRIMATVT